MIFLYVLSGIVLVSVVYILFAPVFIEIDSSHSIYRVRLHKLFSLSFFVDDKPSLIEIKAGFWKKRIDVSKVQKKRAVSTTTDPSTQTLFPVRKLFSVIKSFKVNQFDATFDLGDMQWNGILYPLFCWLSFNTGKNIYINFEGKNCILLQVENNIARMGWAFIRS